MTYPQGVMQQCLTNARADLKTLISANQSQGWAATVEKIRSRYFTSGYVALMRTELHNLRQGDTSTTDFACEFETRLQHAYPNHQRTDKFVADLFVAHLRQ